MLDSEISRFVLFPELQVHRLEGGNWTSFCKASMCALFVWCFGEFISVLYLGGECVGGYCMLDSGIPRFLLLFKLRFQMPERPSCSSFVEACVCALFV